jgi:GxxExxY protein
MTAEINKVTESVIGAAMEVHRHLGPGLLESAYQRALEQELTLRRIPFVAQQTCSVAYKGVELQDAYRVDLLIGGLVIAELKAVDALAEVHEAQLLTYLKFTGCRIGLLINFRARLLKDGLRRLSL